MSADAAAAINIPYGVLYGFALGSQRPADRVPTSWTNSRGRARWYIDGMRTTIDKAGRVVIPAAVRERAGLSPGAELEVTNDELGIRLERIASAPRLVKVGRRLVARPTVPADDRPAVDIAALVEDERNRWP
jgi:AbrB family looped-hinge helix DNA binding protein